MNSMIDEDSLNDKNWSVMYTQGSNFTSPFVSVFYIISKSVGYEICRISRWAYEDGEPDVPSWESW